MMPDPYDISQVSGLSESQAAQRLADEGPNELPSSRRRGTLAIAFEVVKEPMFLLLVACGVVYLLLGEPKEALMLLGFVFVIMGITIIQERRTERALDALRDLSSPRALVIRDGQRKRIAGREVVWGDMIILSEGDRVPADAMMRHSMNLSADESLLTGESVRAEGGLVRRPDVVQARRGRLADRLFGHDGDSGSGRGRGDRHGPADRYRQDRQGSPIARA
jgi:Ca2+-transporting ATPase